MSCPDVDPDNDPYGEPNSPDVDRSATETKSTSHPTSLADKATPSVLQKLQKWGDYAAFGEVVHPSLFIPMKTPLSQAILSEWSLPEEPKHSLTISSLLQQQHFLHRQIGLIIDLSNHETLYAEDIPPFLQYQHVQLVAKVFPDQAQVDQVIDLAEKYWADNPTRHIAIHCAYGFNRTGFVVCSYLVQALGMSVDEALAAFEEARPPGVKHERFVQELHRRFDNHRWGSGHSTVGSEMAGSVGGFSQSRTSYEGSVGSVQSDFKGVAEHLQQKQQVPSRRSGVGVRPPRSPLPGWSPLRQECTDSSVHDSDFAAPSSLRGLPGADPCMTSMSFGSENESLGLNQRAALSALHRVSTAKFQDADDLLTNPSLGLGVSELTAALRQQRPRRDISALPPVHSDHSLHDAVSTPGASSSPGMTSPFAALAHSPHESDGVTLADASVASDEDAQQGGAAPSDHGHQTHQQPSPFGSAHDMPLSHDVDTEKLQQQPQQQHIGQSACDVHEGSNEHEADLQSASSSDSRPNFRRKGRPKCAMM